MRASRTQVREGAVDVAPGITVELARRRRGRPRVLVVLLVGAGALVWWTRRRSAASPSGGGGGYHVLPADGGGWNLTGSDVDDVISHHDTQALGVERATQLAGEDGGGEVVIHGLDGRPRDTKRVAAP
jgi:hypothetical protein